MNNYKNIIEEMREYDGAYAENIADRIEREFIPRPRFKGGEYVHIDDEFKFHGDVHTVRSMEYETGYEGEGCWYIFAENGEVFEPCACEYVELDTIKKVWKDAKEIEKWPIISDGEITSLLQRLEKIIREEYKSKEK